MEGQGNQHNLNPQDIAEQLASCMGLCIIHRVGAALGSMRPKATSQSRGLFIGVYFEMGLVLCPEPALTLSYTNLVRSGQ